MKAKIKILFSIGVISSLAFSSVAFGASAELNRARSLYNGKNYKQASKLLFSLSKNSRYRREQSAIAYELAESLEGLGLIQSAVFQLIKAVRYGKGQVLSSSLEKLTKLTFQVNDDVGLVITEDGNYGEIYRQEIPFTDFPLDEITLWAIKNELNGFTIMLPSEY